MIVRGEFVTVEPMPKRAASPGVKGVVSGAACPKAAHKACQGSPKRPASKALSKADAELLVESAVRRKAAEKRVSAKVDAAAAAALKKAVAAAAFKFDAAVSKNLWQGLSIHACVG